MKTETIIAVVGAGASVIGLYLYLRPRPQQVVTTGAPAAAPDLPSISIPALDLGGGNGDMTPAAGIGFTTPYAVNFSAFPVTDTTAADSTTATAIFTPLSPINLAGIQQPRTSDAPGRLDPGVSPLTVSALPTSIVSGSGTGGAGLTAGAPPRPTSGTATRGGGGGTLQGTTDAAPTVAPAAAPVAAPVAKPTTGAPGRITARVVAGLMGHA